MGMFMGFSPVECVVSYVGMEDRYTLVHSYIWLLRQESFSKSHRLKPEVDPKIRTGG